MVRFKNSFRKKEHDPDQLHKLNKKKSYHFLKVLTSLRFFGAGSYQRDVGLGIYSAMSQPSVSRCIRDVVDFFNNRELLEEWVHFPQNMAEMNTVRRGYSIYKIIRSITVFSIPRHKQFNFVGSMKNTDFLESLDVLMEHMLLSIHQTLVTQYTPKMIM